MKREELFSKINEYVINHIENFQVFITSCNLADTDKFSSGRIWKVKNGTFEKAEV